MYVEDGVDAALWSAALQSDALSPLLWRRLRLLAGDSSISARIARKSSVAETTGKRMAKTHPRASKHCKELNPREILRPRHSQ